MPHQSNVHAKAENTPSPNAGSESKTYEDVVWGLHAGSESKTYEDVVWGLPFILR
jgi:hypothetical protein